MGQSKLLLLLSVFFFVLGNGAAMAQSKSQIKSAEKTAKSKAKEFKKEGWKMEGSMPAEAALKNHYLKLVEFGGKGIEYVGNAPSVKNLKLGGRQARSDIRTQYAEEMSAFVKGRINDGSRDINEDQAEVFIAAYETMLVKEIDGVLQPSYSIYKQRKDGLYEMRVYFILDEEKAGNARRKALRNAAENAKIAQEIADDMSDFINKGFKK